MYFSILSIPLSSPAIFNLSLCQPFFKFLPLLIALIKYTLTAIIVIRIWHFTTVNNPNDIGYINKRKLLSAAIFLPVLYLLYNFIANVSSCEYYILFLQNIKLFLVFILISTCQKKNNESASKVYL